MLTTEFNLWLLFVLIIICTSTDLKNRQIYNFVLLPALLLALYLAYFNNSWFGILNSIKGLILGLLLLIIPFLMGGLGGGDVKLLGVIGSIMGPSFVFTTFIFGALFGGFISLVILILNRQLLSTLGKYFPSFGFPDSYSNPKMLTLPYSIPIGLGAIYSLYSNSLLGGIL